MSSPPAEAPHSVWIGAAGTTTSFGLLRSLRDRWGDRVRAVTGDTNPRELVPAAVLANAHERVPPVCDPAFAHALVEGLRRHEVDTYIPILDREIVEAARLRAEDRLPRGVVAVAPDLAAARTCLNKLETSRWLSAAGLPTPRTWPLTEARWSGTELIAKPRDGVGSVGVRTICTGAELRAVRATNAGDPLVVQEACDRPEVTVDAVRWDDGSTRAVCRERLTVKAGVCTKARVFEEPALEALAADVGAGLDLIGSFCFQVMRSPGRDDWTITDVNPRPGAGTRLTVVAGVDVHMAGLQAARGSPREELPRLPGERLVVREYVEYVV